MTKGIITSPGKFEGEPEYVPDYWQRALEGSYDEDDGKYFIFRINQEDIDEHPGVFNKGEHLILWEDDNGFVHHQLKEST